MGIILLLDNYTQNFRCQRITLRRINLISTLLHACGASGAFLKEIKKRKVLWDFARISAPFDQMLDIRQSIDSSHFTRSLRNCQGTVMLLEAESDCQFYSVSWNNFSFKLLICLLFTTLLISALEFGAIRNTLICLANNCLQTLRLFGTWDSASNCLQDV